MSYLEMGAAGVQLGTRFVCAHESIAHPRFKRAFIRATARDAMPSVQLDARFPVIPVRALANEATARFRDMQRAVIDRCNRGELSQKEAQLEIEHFWAGALRRAVIDGDVEGGSLMAGQSVGMVTREQSTADILAELVDQALGVIAVARGPVAAAKGNRPGRAPPGASPGMSELIEERPSETSGIATPSAHTRAGLTRSGRARLDDPPAAAPSARHHGRVGRGAGEARPDRARGRGRDGRRGLLGLCDAGRRGARTVRDRGAAPRGGAPHPAQGRRRSRRADRGERAPAGAGRCADPPRFRLSSGNRRGDLPLADGRAGAARRAGARGARRAEPHTGGNMPRTMSRACRRSR